ncbi:MAG: PBP1A family penicillin-binding protein [Pseudomonadota bacterium]
MLNLLWLGFALLSGLALSLAGIYLYLDPQIPDAESYRSVKLETPLRIYTADGALMAEYGERRVIPVALAEVPQHFVDALLDTEDKRFYEHSGIDYISLANDTLALLLNREITSGASTITMQVSRNISFSLEQTFLRKFKEMLLALKIERALTKDEILELYINAVPFGKRAYGAQAAAYTYYDQPLTELSLAQLAMLAGIPQAPSAGNPINGPERALARRNLVLSRMLEQGSISTEQYQTARSEPISARVYERQLEAPAAFAAESVRQLLNDYDDLYTGGYSVYTTIRSDKQVAATRALRDGLEAYDRKHGYRGPEAQLGDDSETYEAQLRKTPIYGELQPAIVTAIGDDRIAVLATDGTTRPVLFDTMTWARPYESVNVRGPVPKGPGDVVAVGDLIRIKAMAVPAEAEAAAPEAAEDAETAEAISWQFSQVPDAQGALVSLDPNTGAIVAVEGGYDFALSQFNHALQATRQPGSGFKPFVYSAALASGVTPASIFLDAPLVFEDDALETEYRPDNDNRRYNGPTRLREALYRSINLVSMRVMLKVGAGSVLRHAKHFGFDTERFPRDTQLAIGGGTMAVTPLAMAEAFGVFANGGFEIQPYLIERVENLDGEILQQSDPITVCFDCEMLAALAEDEASEDGALAAEAGASDNTAPAPADEVAAQEAIGGDIDFADLSATEAETDAATESVPEETQPRYAERVLDERNAFVMTQMLRDVITRGTGRRARVLERGDLAGKTGTTNDGTDTWFNGFTADNVTSVWVGFSNYDPLGARAYGGNTALPIWIDYMRVALNDLPARYHPQPAGVVVMRIDPETGEAVAPAQQDSIFEYFFAETAPKLRPSTRLPSTAREEEALEAVELF